MMFTEHAELTPGVITIALTVMEEGCSGSFLY